MPHTTSGDILKRLGVKTSSINLSLRDGYFRVLEKLGNPHLSLPPTFHVAGTNGKGSTLAFLRAMLEAEGKKVHVYTSPHLVCFHERIRLAGALITEEDLCALLHEGERAAQNEDLTFFEITTALAFAAFARTPADFVLLETGLGGRLDATNVIPRPLASIITRISRDHAEFLGDNIEAIAGEKAGIIKKNVPVIIAPQKDARVNAVITEKAQGLECPIIQHGKDWHFERLDHGKLGVTWDTQHFYAPRPSLFGVHQYENAATAIMALAATGLLDREKQTLSGIAQALWPARLQKLNNGPLLSYLPKDAELWLDGGHNDSAGEALANIAKDWEAQDDRPLYVICGMMGNKDARAFISPFAPYVRAMAVIDIPNEPKCMAAPVLAGAAQGLVPFIKTAPSPAEAISLLAAIANEQGGRKARFLVTGSLYLAGHVLQNHH